MGYHNRNQLAQRGLINMTPLEIRLKYIATAPTQETWNPRECPNCKGDMDPIPPYPGERLIFFRCGNSTCNFQNGVVIPKRMESNEL